MRKSTVHCHAIFAALMAIWVCPVAALAQGAAEGAAKPVLPDFMDLWGGPAALRTRARASVG